jgi:hypothetical protein
VAATVQGACVLACLPRACARRFTDRFLQPGTYLKHDTDEISYSDFINKELILFSMADNVRSVPSVADGLKPGKRKVIRACFKRKLKKEIELQCSSATPCSPSSITLTSPSFRPTSRATRRVHL